jgi:inorganic pyrophosphatase
MRRIKTFLLILLIASPIYGYSKNYKNIDPFTADGIVQAVIEIPSGTLEKWELNKTTGKIEWEQKKGKPRIVKYLSYPGNYGFIPKTLLPKSKGGDGDPLDVIVLGEPCLRGEVVQIRLIGIMKMKDRGEQDDKLIGVPIDGVFSDVKSIKELKSKYNGVKKILVTWFKNYKGKNKIKIKAFKEKEIANKILFQAIKDYEDIKQGE